MLTYLESDVFVFYNRGNAITNRLKESIGKIRDDNIMTKKIDSAFTKMMRTYKESITYRVVDAARKSELLIVSLPIDSTGDYRFPDIIPFVKVNYRGKECMIIDISRISTETKIDDGYSEYSVDIPKLYVMMIAAFTSLKLCDKGSALPIEAAKSASMLYSKIFNQVLARLGLLTGSRERNEAFHYLAIRFFLKYYLHCPDAVVDSVANGYVNNHKSDLIISMDDKINDRNSDIYRSFSDFSYCIYDNEFSGIRTDQAKVNAINQSVYLSKFISMYSKNAIPMLWSFDYFFYLLLGAYRKTNVVYDRAFDDIFKDMPREMPKLMTSIYKELT